MNAISVWATILGFCVLGSAVGCGKSSDHPPTFPVSVTVLKDGQPLAGATVTFLSSAPNAVPGSGKSDAEGNVAMTTFETNDGLLPGQYKVIVSKTETTSTPNSKDPHGPASNVKTIRHVPQKYSTLSTTPFTAEVKSGGENKFTFDVKS